MYEIITIPINKLMIPPFDDRFDMRITKEERSHLGTIILEAVRSRESDGIIVFKRLRILKEAKERGIKKVTVAIIGEVEHDADAYLLRMEYVLSRHKPFHVLEQARAVYQFKKVIMEEHGEDKIFKNGGDRRSKNLQKFKLLDLLKKKVPYLEYRIDALRLFDENVGPVGIEGLYRRLKAEGRTLSIRKIRSGNSALKEMGLRAKIEGEIKAALLPEKWTT